MTSQRVEGFRPSSNGFHFANDFDAGPVLTISVPVYGDLPVGDAAGGLCGGMVFTVLDMFGKELAPPPATVAPEPVTPLFKYLAQRLLASFNGVGGVYKYLEWMRFPDDAQFFGVLKSIAWHTINDEWPAIRADLDDGTPCPLGLIKVESVNPMDLGQNHQVLAYGYDLDEDSGDLKVLVYDPNCPDADDVVLSLNVTAANPPEISYSADSAARGFFRTIYAPADPTAALAAP